MDHESNCFLTTSLGEAGGQSSATHPLQLLVTVQGLHSLGLGSAHVRDVLSLSPSLH